MKTLPLRASDQEVSLLEGVRDADVIEAVDENLQLILPDDNVVHAAVSSMRSRILWIWCGIIMYGFATSSRLCMAR